MSTSASVPQWITTMHATSFFSVCIQHQNLKRNEHDRFCTNCHCSLCWNCLPGHVGHKHIKIRRYVYSEVINRKDLSKLFNCSGIQTYLTNRAKVLFLKQRNRQQQHQQICSTRDYRCVICDRNLQDSSLYCSIACKVSAIVNGRIEKYERRYQEFKRRKLSRKGVPRRAPLF